MEIIEEVRTVMPKKLCIVCEEKEGEYHIRGSPKDCYCKECALENFCSLDCLEKI